MKKDADFRCYKAINFDLIEEKLKIHYDSKKYKKAWGEIAKYMDQHGFKHRQYSGYVSKEPMTERQMNKFMRKFAKDLPWVGICSSRFDVTNVGESYDFIGVLRGTSSKGKPLQAAAHLTDNSIGKQQKHKTPNKQTATFTRAALKKEARRVHENAKDAPAPERKHKKNNQEH